MTITLQLAEPWLTLVILGLKTCEGRLNTKEVGNIQKGDVIQWVNRDIGRKERSCLTKVTNVRIYPTFEKYLSDKGLKKCLPTISSMDDGIGVYMRSHFDAYETKFALKQKREEREYGVVAFEFEICEETNQKSMLDYRAWLSGLFT